MHNSGFYLKIINKPIVIIIELQAACEFFKNPIGRKL